MCTIVTFMHRALPTALALLLALAPAGASADRVGLVVRLPPAGPASKREVLGALAMAGARAGHEVVRAPFAVARAALQQGAVARARLVEFRRARQIAAEGIRAYESADLSFAASRLAEARRVALAVADLPGGVGMVAEFSLRLGAVRLDLGHERALEDLRLAARLAPDRPVTTAEFKPDLVRAYDEARATVARPLSLHVSEFAPAGRVAIDGGEAHAVPWQAELSPGLHVVTVSAPGYAPLASIVDVQRNETFTPALDRDAVRSAALAGQSSLGIATSEAEAGVAAEALMRFAELDALIIASVVWRGGNAALLAEWCTDVPVRCTRSVELRYGPGGLASAARSAWEQLPRMDGRLAPGLMTDARVASAEAGPGRAAIPASPHWTERPVVWAGAAVGAAVVVLAAVLLLRDDERHPELTIGDDFLSAR